MDSESVPCCQRDLPRSSGRVALAPSACYCILIAKVDYGRRCQMGDVHTTRMRCGLGRVREYGVSFAINSIARVVEYTLSNYPDYPMRAIDSKSLKIRPRGCGPRLQSCDDEMGDV